MPATFSVFTTADYKLRYREPFITEGMNAKPAINVPRGLYRGFRLKAGSSNFEVGVEADTTVSDHVAVYEVGAGDNSATRYSLSIRKLGGNFTLDLTTLSAVSPVTAYIVLYATYGYGATTGAELRAYTAAEYAALSNALRGELIVLGTCTIPASGSPAPVTVFDASYRTMAWEEKAREALEWSPVVMNPSFEQGVAAEAKKRSIVHWVNRADLAVNGSFSINSGTPHVGTRSLIFTNTSTSASTAQIEQYLEIPVLVGQLVKVTCWVKQNIAPTAGTCVVKLYWGNVGGSQASTTSMALQVLSTTDSSYRFVETTVAVPTSRAVLKQVTIEVSGVTTASTGNVFFIDDCQVFIEKIDVDRQNAEPQSYLRPEYVSAVLFGDPSGYTDAQSHATMSYSVSTPSGEGGLTLHRSSDTYSSTDLPPVLQLLGRLYNLGSEVLSSAANSVKPRVEPPYSTTYDYTLLWESAPEDFGAGAHYRLYTTVSGEILLTLNAQWSPGSVYWIKDANGTAATLFAWRYGQLEYGHRAAADNSTWTVWSKSAAFTVPGTPTVGTASTYASLLKVYDVDGNARTVVDHLGLHGGRYTEIRENWMTGNLVDVDGTTVNNQVTTGSAYTAGNRWTLLVLGTGIATIGAFAGNTTVGGMCLDLFVAANNDQARFASTYLIDASAVGANLDMIHAVEWEVDGADLVGTPSLDFTFGFAHDIGIFAADGIYVRKTSASANWFFHARDNVGITSVDTTVAVASGLTRFRMEFVRDNAGGDGPCARLFINGVLRARIATTLPDTDPLPLTSELKSTGATSKHVRISPVVYRTIRTVADDDI